MMVATIKKTELKNYIRDIPDFPKEGIIFKDTTNGNYYRIEVTNGSVVATDLTD